MEFLFEFIGEFLFELLFEATEKGSFDLDIPDPVRYALRGVYFILAAGMTGLFIKMGLDLLSEGLTALAIAAFIVGAVIGVLLVFIFIRGYKKSKRN